MGKKKNAVELHEGKLRFDCPLGHRLVVPAKKAGAKIRCPNCQTSLVVPFPNVKKKGTEQWQEWRLEETFTLEGPVDPSDFQDLFDQNPSLHDEGKELIGWASAAIRYDSASKMRKTLSIFLRILWIVLGSLVGVGVAVVATAVVDGMLRTQGYAFTIVGALCSMSWIAIMLFVGIKGGSQDLVTKITSPQGLPVMEADSTLVYLYADYIVLIPFDVEKDENELPTMVLKRALQIEKDKITIKPTKLSANFFYEFIISFDDKKPWIVISVNKGTCSNEQGFLKLLQPTQRLDAT